MMFFVFMLIQKVTVLLMLVAVGKAHS